jgi:Lrp/AsnC family leucine-responsive transcriptional regulator
MYTFHKNRQKLILDATDIKILNLLQHNSDLHVNYIATQVYKSPNATHERIRKLQESGVIQRYVAVLDRRLVGRPTLVVTMVRLNNHAAKTLREFARQMSLLDEVQFCLHLSGEFDFLLQVTLIDAQQYEEFLDTQLCALPMVERVQSSFVLKEYKTLAALPLTDNATVRNL